jgi:hypothetical protein
MLTKFCFFSCDAKGCIQVFVPVLAVVYVVEIAVAEVAVDEKKLGVAFRFRAEAGGARLRTARPLSRPTSGEP